MVNKSGAAPTKPEKTIGLFPFILLYGLLAALQGLFPLLVFGPSHYGALALRLSGWALLMELAAPLLFGGVLLTGLIWLWGRCPGARGRLGVRGAGDVVFLVLSAIAAFVAVYPKDHIGVGMTGSPYYVGLVLSFLWQATVAAAFAVVPVYVILPTIQDKIRPGAAAWATLGIVLLVQTIAMALFRLLWQVTANPANLMLLDILPNAIAPVVIGWIPVTLAILVCQRSRKGSIWPAVFAATASAALWVLLAPQLGAVLAGMGMGDSTYLILAHLVFAVMMLLVFAVMSLTIGRRMRKAKRKEIQA